MRLLSIILCTLLASGVAYAQDTPQQQADATVAVEALWSTANAAYSEGNFDKAITDYEKILAQDLHSAALYYNLANAYFKKGELGKALLYYNRASRIAPGDEDIRHNQEYAEKMTRIALRRFPNFSL